MLSFLLPSVCPFKLAGHLTLYLSSHSKYCSGQENNPCVPVLQEVSSRSAIIQRGFQSVSHAVNKWIFPTRASRLRCEWSAWQPQYFIVWENNVPFCSIGALWRIYVGTGNKDLHGTLSLAGWCCWGPFFMRPSVCLLLFFYSIDSSEATGAGGTHNLGITMKINKVLKGARKTSERKKQWERVLALCFIHLWLIDTKSDGGGRGTSSSSHIVNIDFHGTIGGTWQRNYRGLDDDDDFLIEGKFKFYCLISQLWPNRVIKSYGGWFSLFILRGRDQVSFCVASLRLQGTFN